MRFSVLLDKKERFFYIILSFILIAILFTNPFLRFPYDVFYHLHHIEYIGNNTDIPAGRMLWHFLWGKFFILLQIPNHDILLRAKIVHLIQTYTALFSVYFFSKVIIRNLFIEINTLTLKYLSLWSVIIWFTIFATYSQYYQLVWNLWYSVSYQITLPLFWYITALSLVLILEETSRIKKILFILQILLLSRFILQVHSMEFLYYLMYFFVFSIIYLDKIFYFFKKYFYFVIPILASFIYFIKQFQPETSKIFTYLHYEKLHLLYETIVTEGQLLLKGLNRASASINELMYVIGYILIIMTIMIIVNKRKEKSLPINFRMLIFLIITSMFVMIPLFEFSSGLFAIITRGDVVNRLYYSSSLFIIIPVFVYYILHIFYKDSTKIIYINMTIILILFSVWLYSRYDIANNQNYYKNISSIKHSFSKKKIGFNLSEEEITLIGKKLKYYESLNKTQKEIYYYARDDISFVIKFIYRKPVLYQRRGNQNYIKSYHERKKLQYWFNRYHAVVFETPEEFPTYERYK